MTRHFQKTVAGMGVMLLAVAAVAQTPAAPAADGKAAGLPMVELRRDKPVDFEREILPVLKNNCLACHNQTKAKANLILETPKTILKGGDSGPGVVPHKSLESLILKTAAHQIEDTIMPPVGNKSNARDLTPEELGLLKLWIDQGATGEVRGLGAIEWSPLPEGLNPIYAVALTTDGQFAACGRANQIFVYHVPSGQLVTRLADSQWQTNANNAKSGVAHRDLVESLAFNSDGTLLASGSYREVKLWRRPRNLVRSEFPIRDAVALAASADGQRIAVGAGDGRITLLDTGGNVLREWNAVTGKINSLAFSPDGARLLVGSMEQPATVWSVTDGQKIAQLPTANGMNAVAWLGKGEQIALGGSDKTIYLHSLVELSETNATPARQLKGHEGSVTAFATLAAQPSLLLSADAQGSVRLWDVEKGELVREMQHGGSITALAIRDDGKRVASAGENGVAKLWRADDGKLIAELKGDRYADESAAETERELKVAKLTTEFHEKARDAADAENKKQTERVAKATETNSVTEKVFAEKEKAFKDAQSARAAADKSLTDLLAEIKKATEAFENADKTAKETTTSTKNLSDKATQAQLAAERAALSKADAEKIASDAASVATRTKAAVGNADTAKESAQRIAEESASVADKAKAFADAVASDAEMKNQFAAEAKAAVEKAIEKLAELSFVAGQLKPVYDQMLASAPEKKKQATNQIESATKALASAEKEFTRAETRKSVTGHELELAVQAAARASNDLASARSALESAIEYQRKTDGDLDRHKNEATAAVKPIRALAFSPDGRMLATTGDDHRVHTWNANIGVPFEVYPDLAETDAPASTSNSAPAWISFVDARTILSAANEPRVLAWEVSPSWSLERVIGGATDPNSPLADRVMALRFSPDGKLLASGGGEPSRGGEIKIWRVSGGKLQKELNNIHSDAVLSLDFSPDGKLLASGAADRFARVTDLASGKVVKAFEGHTHHVTSVSWKRDGRTLATGGADSVVKIWDFVTGQRRKNIDGFGKEVTSVQFIGATDQAVAASGDSLVRAVNEKGEKLREFAGGKDFMNAVAATPDGRMIVAGGQDSVLRVWNGADGKELTQFAPPEPLKR